MAGAVGRGRKSSSDSKLGRLVNANGILAYRVATECGFSARLMTEYMAGRRIIRPAHLESLAQYFRVTKEELIEDDLLADITLSNGLLADNEHGFTTVAQLREHQRNEAARQVRVNHNLPRVPTRISV